MNTRFPQAPKFPLDAEWPGLRERLCDATGLLSNVLIISNSRRLTDRGNSVMYPPSPMAVSESYRAFILEQLGRAEPVTAKPMFGGVGIYSRGLFFALIAEDRLYFKVDPDTRRDFEYLGMEPFRPFGEESAMGYYEVPADVIENSAALSAWMRKAINVATNAKQRKKPKTSRSRTK